MRVSEIRVNQIRVNQGLGVHYVFMHTDRKMASELKSIQSLL